MSDKFYGVPMGEDHVRNGGERLSNDDDDDDHRKSHFPSDI